MNRKQRIIVSVTGIFLVLLILVGLTYAYFLTQIKGNTNTTSIVSKTTKLEIEYGDGNGMLEPVGVISPGMDINFLDSSGNVVDSKTFTVTNNGNATDYVVLIEEVIVKYKETIGEQIAGEETEFKFPNDFKYTLKCQKKNGNPCNGILEQSFPTKNSVVVSNYIAKDDVHTYTLTMKYIETNIDQSADMNKTMSAKIDITDSGINDRNPNDDIEEKLYNPYDENTLAYKILDNAFYVSGTNADPDLTSLASGSTIPPAANNSDEKTLSLTQDDYGTSYYYRGNVIDNYVNFAGMCWRIVRIQGDGSIKIILEDKDTTCDSTSYTGNWSIGEGNYGYDESIIGTEYVYKHNYLNPTSASTKSMIKAFDNFYDTKLSTYSNKLKTGGWCINNIAYKESSGDLNILNTLSVNELNSYYSLTNTTNEFYYDPYIRLFGNSNNDRVATLQCRGSVVEDKIVGTLTSDEIVFAGAQVQGPNYNFYLLNGLENTFWTLSLSQFKTSATGKYSDWAYTLSYTGNLNGISSTYVSRTHSFRPAISLIPDTEFSEKSGNGTKGNPFVIE